LNLLGENNPKGSKTILEGPFANKYGVHWNVSLEELEKISRF
jgi:hypothetical protein